MGIGTTAGTQSNAYAYNGDGTLVAQTATGTATGYLYGQDTAPLAVLTSGTRTW